MRDKIKNILQLYGTKRNQKECSSGIGLEHTELDDLLQEIYERKKKSEGNYHQQSSEKAKQIKKESEPAEDMQTKYLENFSKLAKGKLRIVPQAVVHIMKRDDVEAQVVIRLFTCGKSQRGIFSCDKLS